jgi:signal transduction histidine kinase
VSRPRILLSRRRWALIWFLSFAVLAAAAPALAWWASRNPGMAGRAQALADAEAFETSLAARGRSWREELLSAAVAGAAADPLPYAPIRWSAEGVLTSPRPPAAGAPLLNAPPAEDGLEFTPAQGWLLQARQTAGDANAGLEACAQGLASAAPGETLTRARLRLLAAQIAARAGSFSVAAEQLSTLREETGATALLDDRPLALLTAHRLADALEAGGDPASAQLTRELLRQQLVAGELPLAAVEVERELRFLREAVATGEAELSTEERAAVLLLGWGGALQLVMRADPVPEGLLLPGGMRALLDPANRRGAVFEEEALRVSLLRAWTELLPADGSWEVAAAESAPAQGQTLGAVAAPPGMPAGWRLVLTRPEAYTEAITRRQNGLMIAAAVLAAAFLAVGWIGQRALLRQAELERLRVEFVSGVSHELRTPAASLALLADNLAEGRVIGGERQMEYYEALRRDARRLQRLVADVLDVSRLERGSFRVEPLVQDPAPILRRSAAEHRARLADAGLELREEIAADLPATALDAEVIERVLANLLENARKYASAGEVVVLRARAAGGRLIVELEDRGPGIPAAWRERVFQPFERVPDGGPMSAGAGLGLALVLAAAEAHGGSVRVEPGADGIGARFVLEFPPAGAGA